MSDSPKQDKPTPPPKKIRKIDLTSKVKPAPASTAEATKSTGLGSQEDDTQKDATKLKQSPKRPKKTLSLKVDKSSSSSKSKKKAAKQASLFQAQLGTNLSYALPDNPLPEEQPMNSNLRQIGVPGLPKHAMTAFMFFRRDVNKTMKQEQVDLKLTQISKVASDLWHKATPETRKPFEDKSVADRKRFDAQMEEFKQKGFFMTESGLKSTDAAAKDETSKLSKRTEPKKKKGAHKERKFDKDQAAMRIFMSTQAGVIGEDDESRIKQFRALKLQWKEMAAEERQKYEKLAAVEELKVTEKDVAFRNFTKQVDFNEVQKMHNKKLDNSERAAALRLAWKNMSDEQKAQFLGSNAQDKDDEKKVKKAAQLESPTDKMTDEKVK